MVANGSGAASFTSANLTAANNGQTLRITGITITSATPNCSQAFTQNVTLGVNPTSVGGTATATAGTICAGTGTTINLSGNTGTIQWQQSANGTTGWANVSGGSGATTATYTTPNLNATTYYRAVVTSGVCVSANSTVAQVTVNQSIVVANNGTKTDASCNGTATGSITLGTISGGNGSYNINWTGPGGYTGSGSTISNLAAGTYIYSVSGGVCAAASASIIITEPGLLNAVVSATEVSCFGLDDGTITIDNPTGGYGMFEYTINGGGNWQSSGNYTGLMPGTYNVRIRDAQHTSCVRTLYSVLQIGEPDAVVLTTTSTNVTCNGAANGTITASASGGTSGSPVITVNGQPYNPNATYAPGMYTVVATDDDANYTGVCTDTKIINIMEPSPSRAAVR